METGEAQQLQTSVNLPEGVTLFSHQVSGHKHGQGRLGIGVLKHENGDLLKPLLDGDRRAVIELSFYNDVYQTCPSDPLLQELSNFLPAFYGKWRTHIEGKDVKYLRLEDVSKNFKKPSVMDIKMGRRTYDDDANEAKILSQSKKFAYGDALGIRILGMKVYNDEKKMYLPQNAKSFWRQLNPETITSGLKMYLTTNKCVNRLILSGFIHKLVQLSNWFSQQRRFKFIGSSLLFVYEGEFSSWTTWTQSNENQSFLKCFNANNTLDEDIMCPICNSPPNNSHTTEKVDVCCVCGLSKNICSPLMDCNLLRVAMIDFAHCFPSDKEDTNYTYGLDNLINYLKELFKIQTQ